MASSSRDSSFFLTPMHPGWHETRVFREPLASFLDRYMRESREENWYTYSNLVPELRRLLPRPSLDRHLRTVVNAKGGEQSDHWDGRLWLGYSEDGKQESPLHRDTHENLHCMVQGRKLFTIVDPSLTERLRVPAESLNYSPLHVHAEEGLGVPARRCVLEAGEYLFLPANWWHNVVALAGRNIGINFWYTWWVRPGEVRLLAHPRALHAAFRRMRNTSAAGLADGRKLARRGQAAEVLAVFPDATCRLRFGDGAALDFPFEAVAEQLSVARGGRRGW